MRALVTGATGFLGSHLCRRLLGEGFAVRALVRPTSDRGMLEGLKLEIVEGDVTDCGSIEAAVRGAAVVIHAAAVIDYSARTASLQRSVNEGGSHTVALACRRHRIERLIHVSSVAAVGIPGDPTRPADESFAFNLAKGPLYYHRSKRRAEALILAQVAEGLDAVIVNPASIFGPFGPGYRGAVMMAKVRGGPIIPCFTGGLCVVHVEDVASGVLSALRYGRRGERYILGGENLTYWALAERTAEKMGLRRRILPLPALVTGTAAALFERTAVFTGGPPRISYAVHYCASRFQYYDSGKARRELGYASRSFAAILNEALSLGAC